MSHELDLTPERKLCDWVDANSVVIHGATPAMLLAAAGVAELKARAVAAEDRVELLESGVVSELAKVSKSTSEGIGAAVNDISGTLAKMGYAGLTERLQAAEQAVERKQGVIDTLARMIETRSEAVVLATDSQDLIDENLDGDWDTVWHRLPEIADKKRAAEQAVARVRGLREGELCSHCLTEVHDALDGEQHG